MKIIKLIQYFVYLVPVAAGALVCLFLYRNRENRKYLKDRDRVRLWIKEGLGRLKGRRRAVLLLTALYTACFLGASVLERWTGASTVLGLNYKEASQGLNPNSTRFNTYDIVCDEVLEEALRQLGSSLSAQQLRGTLSVFPLTAGGELSTEQQYISTEYVLRYTARPATLALNPWKTVDTVAEVYRERFKQLYEQKTNALDIDMTRIDDADYLDKPTLMREMASIIQEYMRGCQLKSPVFRSAAGETFTDVGTRAETFKNVTLERLNAYILANGVSKDPAQYISRLGYENTIQNVSYSKNLAAYQVRMNAIDFYERDMTKTVLVPTRDENGEFYMSRTKIGVDNFAAEAANFAKLASDFQKRIEVNNYEIERLRQGSGANAAAVEQLLEAAKQELLLVSESAKQILQEYSDENVKEQLVIKPQGRSLKRILRANLCALLTAGFLLTAGALSALYPEKKTPEETASGKQRRQAGGR